MPMTQDWWKPAFEKGWYPLPNIASEWKKKTALEVLALKKLLNLPKGSKILDVACGVGRHSIELAKQGYSVTGIDISPKYLEIAKRNARKAGVDVEFRRCDMRRLPFNGEFDAAINLFSSFGYFLNPNDDKKVLFAISRSLSKGGIFVIDNIDYEFLTKHFIGQSWSKLADGTLILEHRQRPDKKTQVVNTDWLFVSPKGKRTEMKSEIRGFTNAQLGKLLKRAGFQAIKRHGPLGPQGARLRVSPRLVLSARKSK